MEPEQVAGIVKSLTKAQREALLEPQWIHPGGMTPIALVNVTDEPWPQGVAQFFTLRTDSLTPLGLAVRSALKENDRGE